LFVLKTEVMLPTNELKPEFEECIQSLTIALAVMNEELVEMKKINKIIIEKKNGKIIKYFSR
jgi:hypothetical protein